METVYGRSLFWLLLWGTVVAAFVGFAWFRVAIRPNLGVE